MTEIPDSLRSLFSATVTERDGDYVLEVPPSEIEHDAVDPGRTYRVVVLPASSPPADTTSANDRNDADTGNTGASGSDSGPGREGEPPVAEGEVREVTIETTGDQGDGIAKVDRGYVVIVPDGRPGETIPVEIDTVRPNVAFARAVDGR
jgi:predicted RNA-binding protein with TRAM domain